MGTTIQRKVRGIYVTSTVLLALLLFLLLTLGLHTTLHAAPALADQGAMAETGAITGRVTASDGGDLGPLRVFATGVTLDHVAEANLDATGRYTLSGLPPDNYHVTFNFDDEGPYLKESYNNRDDFDTPDPVLVAANATTSGIDAELQLGGTISGQITDTLTGAPLAGIPVEPIPRSPDLIYWGGATYTDAAGRYLLVGLHGGEYDLCFTLSPDEKDSYLPECYDNQPPQGERQAVVVVEGSSVPNINAALTLGGMIRGRVTSELTGEPLIGIRVDADRVDRFESRDTLSDAAGFYTLTNLHTGNYHVIFNTYGSLETYASETYNNRHSGENSDPVAVTESMTTTGIDATLTFILNITGRVTFGSSQAGIDSVNVIAYDAAGDEKMRASTDFTGHYTITALSPGPYRIRFGDDLNFGSDSYVDQYYSDRVIFEEADWVTVTAGVVIRDLDASLVVRQQSDLALATATTRPGALLATRTGYFNPLYTLDGGQSWHTFATLPVDGFDDTPQIAIIPKDDSTQPLRFLLAITDARTNEDAGIYRSGDGGATWSQFQPPPDPRCTVGTIPDVLKLTTSPADPLRVYAVTLCSIVKYLTEPTAFFYQNIFSSVDGGVVWQRVTTPTDGNETPIYVPDAIDLLPSPVEPNRVYASYVSASYIDSYIAKPWYRSDNNGQTWMSETFTVAELALDWTDAAKLYGVQKAEYTNIFRYTGKRSANGGMTWDAWPQQPCRTSFQQLLSLPTANTLLMQCDQGLYRSANGGDSWEKLSTQSGGSLSVHSGDRELVLWVRASELWGSRDQGATWNNLGGWQETRLPNIRHP